MDITDTSKCSGHHRLSNTIRVLELVRDFKSGRGHAFFEFEIWGFKSAYGCHFSVAKPEYMCQLCLTEQGASL